MTTAAVIVAAVLAVAAVLFVARPFLLRREAPAEAGLDGSGAAERLRRLEERDRALAALKELEFDHRTGKISDADYRELAGTLRREAAEAIAALDAADGQGRGAAGEAPVPAGEREEQPR